MDIRTVGVLAVLMLAATGCGATAPAAPSGAAGAASGPKVQRVVWASELPAAIANNPRMLCCNDHHQLRPIYENLIGIDAATGKQVPQLATAWSLEQEGRAVRFKLREGVRFNSGDWGNFSAKDVAYTWQVLVDNEDSSNRRTYWKATVKSVDVVNDQEVLFNLVPEAQFFNGVSELYGQLLMHSKAYQDAKGEPKGIEAPAPPGTGPYEYDSRDQASYIRFKRVGYQHWRTMPDFPELEIRWIKEPSTRLAGLLAGEIHLTKLPPDLTKQATASGMKVAASKVAGTRVFGQFGCCYSNPDGSWPMYPNSPLLNAKVRQALNKAIDRDELKKVFAPNGEPMYLNSYHPTRLAWNPTWQTRFHDLYGYDPAKARALLAEAGYGPNNPMSTSVLLNDILQISGANDLAEAIAGYWRQVGVKVDLVQLDAATQAAQGRAYKFDNHFQITGTTGDQIQGIFVYATPLNTPAAIAYFTPEYPAVYKAKIGGYVDPDKWLPGLQEFGEMAYTQFQNVPLWYVPVEAVYNPTVVSGWVFPGAVHSTWTHMENIKAAK